MNYGDRVRRFRKSMKKNQDELAVMVGLSRQSLYRIEKNESEIGIEFLNKIGQYGVNTHWLITGEGEMFGNSGGSSSTAEKEQKNLLSIPYIDVSASAGFGIMNLEEIPAIGMMQISADLLGIQQHEIKNCFLIKARGNSMSPKIESGDYLFVKHVYDTPRYLEGIYIVNYDGELYVKELQLTSYKLIMRSINKDYEDIIIPNTEKSDIHLQIVAKVLVVLKNI